MLSLSIASKYQLSPVIDVLYLMYKQQNINDWYILKLFTSQQSVPRNRGLKGGRGTFPVIRGGK